MPNRAVSIVLALFVALAGAGGAGARAGAVLPVATDCRTACCGGDCRCGDDCRCAVDDEPAAPADAPTPFERSRGERAPLFAAPAASVAAISLLQTFDLGARPVPSGARAAPPSCRLRLALVSRWNT
jgi:hypothetical protein